MQPDVIGVIEAVYHWELGVTEWMQGIVGAVRPLLDEGAGLFGMAYDASQPGRFRVEALVTAGCPAAFTAQLGAAYEAIDEGLVRRSFLAPIPSCPGSAFAGWRESPLYKLASGFGVEDGVGINGRDAGGTGCVLVGLRTAQVRGRSRYDRLFKQVAAHLASGRRLRGRLASSVPIDNVEAAEAVVAPSGRVEHAVGAATERKALASLSAAALAIDRARSNLRQRAPDEALDLWRGLVGARWTLVDRFERDGHRYFLARENQMATRGLGLLTPRERQVVACGALGRSTKEIAYELGISDSTVRVLLLRAQRKLSAKGRADLLGRFGRSAIVDAESDEVVAAPSETNDKTDG